MEIATAKLPEKVPEAAKRGSNWPRSLNISGATFKPFCRRDSTREVLFRAAKGGHRALFRCPRVRRRDRRHDTRATGADQPRAEWQALDDCRRGQA